MMENVAQASALERTQVENLRHQIKAMADSAHPTCYPRQPLA